jgi:leader peptidase (prepilin peptidase)/N-methyltransferase
VNAILASMVPLPPGSPSEPLVLLGVFAAGACIGSFLNVCIHRIPAEESIVSPGSRCPRCAAPIAWYDNVPILSWALLRARCRACGVGIPVRYPLVEAATGGLAVLALAHFGVGAFGVIAFAFTAALLLITFIDLDHRFIPDEVSLPGTVIGLGVAFLPGGVDPLDALIGVLLGGGLLWGIAWGYERLTGVEGMGLGDVKLLAMIGAFLGWQAIPTILIVSSVTGSLAGLGVMITSGASARGRRVVQRLGVRALLPYAQRAARRTEIPFGPFLALGAVLALYVPRLTVFPTLP